MNNPRFSYERGLEAPPRLPPPKSLKWIRVSQFGDFLGRVLKRRERRKIFAVVVPSMLADSGRKPVQRVLIFDSHPESLRLVFGRPMNSVVDLATPPRTIPSYVVLGLILILAVVLGMAWPLV